MKHLSLLLVLVMVTTQGVAGVKNRLPQLAVVKLKDFAPLGEVVSPHRSMALLPIQMLDKGERDKLRRQKVNDRLKTSATGTLVVASTAVYSFFLSPSHQFGEDFLHSVGLTLGFLLSYNLILMAVEKSVELSRIEDTFKRLIRATEYENNIVLYEKDGKHHVGILNDVDVLYNSDAATIVINAQGHEEAIAPEQLDQVVAIRDNLPLSSFGGWLINKKPMPNSISADFSDDYRGATLAFTHDGKNHLGIVDDVRFAADGQGELSVITAAGKELIITRGKQGEPTVATEGVAFNKGDKLRGVLIME